MFQAILYYSIIQESRHTHFSAENRGRTLCNECYTFLRLIFVIFVGIFVLIPAIFPPHFSYFRPFDTMFFSGEFLGDSWVGENFLFFLFFDTRNCLYIYYSSPSPSLFNTFEEGGKNVKNVKLFI